MTSYLGLSPLEYQIPVLLHTSRELLFLKKSSESFIMHDCTQPSPVGGMEEERNLARGIETLKNKTQHNNNVKKIPTNVIWLKNAKDMGL